MCVIDAASMWSVWVCVRAVRTVNTVCARRTYKNATQPYVCERVCAFLFMFKCGIKWRRKKTHTNKCEQTKCWFFQTLASAFLHRFTWFIVIILIFYININSLSLSFFSWCVCSSFVDSFGLIPLCVVVVVFCANIAFKHVYLCSTDTQTYNAICSYSWRLCSGCC